MSLWLEIALRSDARGRLLGKLEPEFFQQEFLIGVGLGVAAQDQGPAVGRGEMNIEHLDGGQLVQDGAGG